MAKCSLCGKEITRGYPVCPDCYSGYFVADKLQEQELTDKPMTNGDILRENIIEIAAMLRAKTNEEIASMGTHNEENYRRLLDWLNAPAE